MIRFHPAKTPVLVVLAAGAVLSAPTLAAQTGAIDGRVVHQASGRSLEAVQIEIAALGIGRISNTQGRFSFQSVPVGVHELRARLIGYEEVAVEVEVRAGVATDVSLNLSLNVINLDGFTVTGTAFEEPPITLPTAVAVSTREVLIEQGSPRITDFLKRLPVSHGVVGELNSWYNSTGSLVSESAANINLRGLGASRTLVLVNGRRQSYLPSRLIGGRWVDVNTLPSIAIERIEVLKEGASAVYGSDAVAGVANFVTRGDFSGMELSASYDRYGGGGDTDLGVIVGGRLGDDLHGVLSAEWAHRLELGAPERSWTLRDFITGGGGWSGTGNPGVFLRPTLAGTETAEEFVAALLDSHWGTDPSWHHDPSCAEFGGYVESWTCRFRYAPWDNIIDDTDFYRALGELGGSLDENTDFRLEGLFARAEIPNWLTTPSFPPVSPYDGTQMVTPEHPGRRAFCADQAGSIGLGGPGCLEDDWYFFGRLVGNAGPGRRLPRSNDTYRLAAELEREIELFGNDAHLDLAFSYSGARGNVNQPAEYHYRKFLAYRGFGGPNCGVGVVADPTSPSGMRLGPLNGAQPGQGECTYYNPFSNAIDYSAQPGSQFEDSPNPFFRPELANASELIDWINEEVDLVSDAQLVVADASVHGSVMDGALNYALGYQFRRFGVNSVPNAPGDVTRNPCPVPEDRSCRYRTGPFTFITGFTPYDDVQTVHRLFGEIPFRFGSRIEAQIAANYEYHSLASSFDPKIAARVRVAASDSYVLSLRGSLQTTFRTPSVDDLNEDVVVSLQYVPESDTYKAIDSYGSAALMPERAFTYNAGAILLLNRARFTVDYWSYDFNDVINSMPFTSITALYAEGGASRDAVKELVTCPGGRTDGSCDVTQVERIEVRLVNWPGMETSGIDLHGESRFPLGDGEFHLGLTGTYTVKYDVAGLEYNGFEVQSAIEGAGALNFGHPLAWPLPRIKGRFNLGYEWGETSIGAYVNSIGSYVDRRYEGASAPFDRFRDIDSFTTLDLNLSREVGGIRAVLTGVNLLDTRAPAVNWETGYDGFTHDPKGRRIKLALAWSGG